MTLSVRPQPFDGFCALGRDWRALEATIPASVFQSWTWVGCLAEERFPDPVVLRAERQGRLVGLALFNRRRGLLHLGESGDPERDRPFVEHNGPLAADPEVAAALLRAAWSVPGTRGLVLGGVPPALVQAARGVAVRRQDRPSPLLDLAALRAAGGDLATRLSANTRQQIRRSDRFYAAGGTLELTRAGAAEEVAAWFPDFVALHEATWRRRGQAGAFATPFLERFHRSLMARAMADGVLDLLRLTGPGGIVGLLYNLHHRGITYAYQSALADPAGHAAAKPGLSCHARAIALALRRGDQAYDFLAGSQRYKLSFADRSPVLAWAELARPWSPRGILGRVRAALPRPSAPRATDPASTGL
ncbi:cellulose biosynthesis protein CelD [Falsiroseomonas bella]|uniref:Cellulose biosynthesis protein CelD n=1 Tax=Falsiroseomonas bella TaxID=2184016 RepID=A0A317FJI5_9PROT|nr:GNAT family N-acetyltransferase [Falsiroseomonas bella]PWS39211.1 cellulose biosynthesis protein CelD [Falsiroseomonas bella]